MINIEETLLYEGLPFVKLSFYQPEYEHYLKTAGGFIPHLVEFDDQENVISLKCYLDPFDPEQISISVVDDNNICITNSENKKQQVIKLHHDINVKTIKTSFLENAVIISIEKQEV